MKSFALAIAFLSIGCTIERRPEGGPFSDDFNRATLGDAWRGTGADYRLVNGELVISGGRNRPLWLTKALPRDAVIEVDAWSNAEVGDIKLEAYGDGKSFATTLSYTATSYVFIFGGWQNSISALCRINEHGADRRARSDVRVERGRKYHFRITRKGNRVDWEVDGKPFLSYDDPKPLDGPDHAYFGFNDWEAELHFDNLKITPL